MTNGGSGPVRRSGGCRCGAVRLTFAGAPVSVRACLCSDCRKASGAPNRVFDDPACLVPAEHAFVGQRLDAVIIPANSVRHETFGVERPGRDC